MMGKQISSLELGFIRLDRRKKQPLARQLYAALSRAILEGQLGKGFRLPSTRGLANDLGVSRTTVINAFDQLTAEGFLSGSVGKGTFVSAQLPEERQMARFCPSSSFDLAAQSPTKQGQATALTASPVAHNRPAPFLSKLGRRLHSNRVLLPDALEALAPFLPGVPALDEFPVAVWSRLVRRCWKRLSTKDLSYGSPAGFGPLRSAIAEYVRAFRGVRCDVRQVFVVSGTQQAIDMIARLAISPGDKVLFEDPGYQKARMTIEAAGAKIVPVPVDQHGFDVDRAMAIAPDARLAYLTPSHQFPMGVTLSLERRMKLIEWAQTNRALIFEDDYDSEYRYSHRPIPSLQGLGNGKNIVYVGSFSKVVYPSMSMAYIVVPESIIDVVSKSLNLWSRPPSTIDQMVLADFIAEGHFARHLRRMRQIHHQRRGALVDAIDEHLSDQLEVIGCDAGLHCAVNLLQHSDDVFVARSLKEVGVITRPLSSFSIRKKTRTPGLVLGFASSPPSQIVAAVKRMKTVFETE